MREQSSKQSKKVTDRETNLEQEKRGLCVEERMLLEEENRQIWCPLCFEDIQFLSYTAVALDCTFVGLSTRRRNFTKGCSRGLLR